MFIIHKNVGYMVNKYAQSAQILLVHLKAKLVLVHYHSSMETTMVKNKAVKRFGQHSHLMS